jgi:hypothetical protein
MASKMATHDPLSKPKQQARLGQNLALPVLPKGDKAMLDFKNGWEQSLTGELVAGGQLVIKYDIARLPHLRHSSSTHWGIETFIRFHPSEMVSRGPVRDGPFECSIPAGTTQLELWFKNWAGDEGSRRESFDSKHSANYQFTVKPAPAEPPTPS